MKNRFFQTFILVLAVIARVVFSVFPKKKPKKTPNELYPFF